MTLSCEPNALMLRAKNGDHEAFGQLYQQLFTPVFRYLCARLNDRDTAEDLTQVAFMKVFQSLQNYEDRGFSPLSYCMRVARNTLFDHYRKKREIILDDEEHQDRLEQMCDSGDNPHDEILQDEKKTTLLAALEQLQDDQREVLYLKFIRDLSNKEIAEVLEKSEANVRKIQSRGLQALRERMQNLSSLK